MVHVLTILGLLGIHTAHGQPHRDETRSPIVGGEPAEEPGAVVAIFRDGSFGCTGTLITPRHVLTAAHCSAGITHVILDALDWSSEGTRIDVASVTEYETYWTSYDLAVIELAATAAIEPQPLLLDCLVDNYLFDGSPARLVGFGAVDPNGLELGSQLMSATTTVVDADCQDPIFGCNDDVAPGGELVAGGNGTDTCVGDSGGPVFITTELGERLAGVTSRGIDQASEPCGDGGIYVRPDAAIEWLESVIGEPLERPNCDALNDAPRPSDYELLAFGMQGGTLYLSPNDPDLDDQHTFTLITPPSLGNATVASNGTVAYWPESSSVEADSFIVRISDSGVPSLYGDAVVRVAVVSGNAGPPQCGCSATVGLHFYLLLPLLPFIRRSS